MKELCQKSDYSQMQEELSALRQEMEQLKALHANHLSRHSNARRLFFGRHGWAWLRITAAVVLALGVLGAQNKPDALYIDQNGNVGINKTNPAKPLDVNGDAVFRKNVTVEGQMSSLDVSGQAVFRDQIQAKAAIPAASSQQLPANSGVVIGNSDIYFTNTPHTHTAQANQQGFAAIENDSTTGFNALMILGRNQNNRCPNGKCDRVVRIFDKVGIGDAVYPKVPLDVAGEIRGRPWLDTRTFEVKGTGSVKMTKVDHSVCFLTYVRGKFAGIGEWVEVIEKDNYWYLQSGQGGAGVDILARARCIGAPDDSW